MLTPQSWWGGVLVIVGFFFCIHSMDDLEGHKWLIIGAILASVGVVGMFLLP